MSGLRQSLFVQAVNVGLADDGDALVARKKMFSGKSVVQKHADDIWSLMYPIKHSANVPRTLLKNGKRAKADLTKSQSHNQD